MPQMMHCFQKQAKAMDVDTAFASTASKRGRTRFFRRERDVAKVHDEVVVFVDTDSGVAFLGQRL